MKSNVWFHSNLLDLNLINWVHSEMFKFSQLTMTALYDALNLLGEAFLNEFVDIL